MQHPQQWSRLGRHIMRNYFSSPRRTNRKTRLELESLETRALPSGTAFGGISGFAFVDTNNNGAHEAEEVTVPGISVTLTGNTNQGAAVNLTATTNAAGKYDFDVVQPGTYQITGGTAESVLPGIRSVFPGLTVAAGDELFVDLPYRGFSPSNISMRLFLTTTTSADLPFDAPGTGVGNYRANGRPLVKSVITDVTVARNSANTVVDLAGNFDDPDLTNSQVRLNTSSGAVNFELFDRTASRTVANFYNYLTSDRFDNTIFHRRANKDDGSLFVLQGGGFEFVTNPSNLVPVQTDRAVQNEFGASNTKGTVAMAKVGGDANSATSQFFINLADNGSNLDSQNGGFTVFGKLLGPDDQAVVDTLAAIPKQNQGVGPDSPFTDIPLQNYSGNNFPTDTVAANYAMVNSMTIVRRDEFITYSVLSNTNTNLVTATITNNRLTLQYAPNQSGNATITIRATDRFGSTVDDTFLVTVN